MWNIIKSDPLLKAVTIIVLGVLAFGFAFNIMFGGGGYSLNANIGYTLSVLIKIVLIIAVFQIVLLAYRQVNKYVLLNNKFNYEEFRNDSLAKYTVISISVLIGLYIIYSMFYDRYGINGLMMGQREMGESMMGNNVISTNASFNNGITTTAILLLLAKFLLIISVIGLLIGIVMYLKNNAPYKAIQIFGAERVKCGKCGYTAMAGQKFCPECGESLTVALCGNCGKEMKSGWKCCPECGYEVVKTHMIKEV